MEVLPFSLHLYFLCKYHVWNINYTAVMCRMKVSFAINMKSSKCLINNVLRLKRNIIFWKSASAFSILFWICIYGFFGFLIVLNGSVFGFLVSCFVCVFFFKILPLCKIKTLRAWWKSCYGDCKYRVDVSNLGMGLCSNTSF